MEKKLTGYPTVDKPWLKYYDENFLKEFLPEMTILDYMKLNSNNYSNNTAISYYGNNVTYGELYDNIDNSSKVLAELGVNSNDRIMYLMPNIPETAYLFYGASQIGAVSDFVDPRPDSVDLKVSAKKILALIEEEKVKYLVALDQCYLGMLKPIENELKDLGIDNIMIVSANDSMNFMSRIRYLEENIRFDGIKKLKIKMSRMKEIEEKFKLAKDTSVIELVNYSDLIKDCRFTHFDPMEYMPDKLVSIVHTSGTSSPKPKPIPLTHDNFNAYVHQTFGANMPMNPGDKALHMLPYFAAFGIVDVVHAGLCHGNNLIQIPEFSPANLGKIIMRYKPQTVIGTPTWFLSMVDDPAIKNADLSFLKMVTYGGASMETDDEQKVNQFLTSHNSKAILTKGHGMSETCGCASYATDCYNHLGSVGIPMPNTTYGLVNPETKELIKFADGDETLEGELIISSKAITSGVLDGKVLVKHGTYNGENYIYTGDIARMDRDGVITFLSRNDRSFMRYDGFKVKPYEIENVIKENPKVKYCIIAPYFDEEKYGNMPLSVIVPENNEKLSYDNQVRIVEDIINNQFINNQYVSTRQIPSKFRFVKDVPLTINGKINYNQIKNQGLVGDEISVYFEETNISIGDIKIVPPKLEKVKVLSKK